MGCDSTKVDESCDIERGDEDCYLATTEANEARYQRGGRGLRFYLGMKEGKRSKVDRSDESIQR